MSNTTLTPGPVPGTESDPIGAMQAGTSPESGGTDLPISTIPAINSTVAYQGGSYNVDGQQSNAVTGDSVMLNIYGVETWVSVADLG